MAHSVITEMTRDLLARSLMTLMERMPLDKITVRDIVDACSLNRRTFYYHFRDTYDLLGWLYKKEVIADLVDWTAPDGWEERFVRFLSWHRDHRAFSLCAYRSLDREYVERFHQSVIFRIIRGVIDGMAESHGIQDERKAYLANLYAVAFVAISAQWILNGMEEEPRELVGNLASTIRGSLKHTLRRYRRDAAHAGSGRRLKV